MLDLGAWNYPWHDYTIGAMGHVVLLVVGYLASLILPAREAPEEALLRMTLWGWLKERAAERAAPVGTPEP
jgi:SSS family solute:Na+ symporter